MASIYKRKDSKGKVIGWRAVVRMKGYPTVCKQCDRQKEAEDWAADVERQIKQGQFTINLYKSQHTFADLLERYRNDGALEHIRAYYLKHAEELLKEQPDLTPIQIYRHPRMENVERHIRELEGRYKKRTIVGSWLPKVIDLKRGRPPKVKR